MAQSTPSFDKAFAETLCDLQVPKAIKISPDGQKLANRMEGKNHLSTLWLATHEANSSRQLTRGTSNDTNPTWHPRDNSRIAFLSDRAKPGESSAIWSLSLEGGDPVPLTKEVNEQSIESYAFSPSGNTIAYVSADEKENGGEEDDEKPEVWGETWDYAKLRLLDVETLETKVLVGDGHIGEIAWTPDGKSLVFMSTLNPHIEEAMLTGTSISTVDVRTGEVKRLCTVMNEPYNLIWAPDGKIYFITGIPPDKDSGGRAVYTIDPVATTTGFTRVTCENDDADDMRIVNDKIFLNRQGRIGSTIGEIGGVDLFAETDIWAWDAHIDRQGVPFLAASLSDVNTPYEVFIIGGPDRTRVKVSNHGKPLERHSFGFCNRFTCQSSDGEVELDGLYLTPASRENDAPKVPLPTDAPKVPLPTVVLIHGGPRDRNCNGFDTSCFNWAPYLLSKGYGVLLPQYRGGSGRGETFAMYSVGGQGKYDYQDVITITDAAIKKGYVHPEKLMVGGWSQGGLLTYLCSVRNGDHGLGWRFKAAIAGAGVVDIESLAITADLGSTYEVELAGGHTIWTLPQDDTRNRQGSAIWEVSAAMERSRREVNPVIPPMLILHGEKDERCPFSQAEGFRRALRHYDLKCEFVKYPGEGHGIEKQAYWLDMLERVGRWCDLYIGESETPLSIR
ncbi:hypothetical protein FIE12Z_10257 [Fusarium flagelliforme]|uniref:Probable dipeptidyl-aminopeptidase B n=1 Tax=Fusarium flagelliforme TaxID=2675880 RepID=A0A395MCA7_9HYPO|nr:hypothetical protein FIE12Z_10257 [Fusarium flagelliforme]